jgi:MoaA/NifB/PqqE/SkfB family radical SAM enzyme
MQGVKRIFDTRALCAQLIVTDDCNFSCRYWNEYIPGAPPVPLATLQERIDRPDALGVMAYDLFGGEPLLHPDLLGVMHHDQR